MVTGLPADVALGGVAIWILCGDDREKYVRPDRQKSEDNDVSRQMKAQNGAMGGKRQKRCKE
ncbi:hypothetical protein EYF80_036664 [Liparis tanakae]|uniref:Uncharacterized protein n=1 Tax=Liparis tanakae TaxID=230148 RepID=A0A4Z2GIS3_9TELE|nr:hypothetical protein EYF80_036664 [Liparis tanakae]